MLRTSFTELIQKCAFREIMLSIQEFSSLACAVFLMLILGFMIKMKRGLMNRDARMPENLGQPVEARRRSVVRNEENYKYNYSVPCNRKKAREHDERR